MALSTEIEPLHHEEAEPPADSDIRVMIGAAWSRYRAALKGLDDLGLEPEFYRYDPSGGWAIRFQVHNVTGCALYLAKSLIGLVAIGSRVEAAMETGQESDEQMRRLVLATPRKGKIRWVQMPLRSQEDVHRFLELVAIKVRVWARKVTPAAGKGKGKTTSKAAKATKITKAAKTAKTPAESKKAPEKVLKAATKATKTVAKSVKVAVVAKAAKARVGKKASVNHTPRRRTSSAAAGRKKADTRPRRSAARRSSRD
jgi:hypothetical protein